MGVELSSSWNPISPRISFSYDLSLTEAAPTDPHRRLDSNLSDLAQDFDFCIEFGREKDSVSPADELFSDGKILPLQVNNPAPCPSNSLIPEPKQLKSASDSSSRPRKKESLREILANSDSDENPQIGVAKSFWGFSRSSSLNCSSNNSKKGLIRSLPLLSRSYSTGCASSNLRRPLKDSCKQQENPIPKSQSQPPSGFGFFLQRHSSKKIGSGGKSHLGSHANGLRISPVLNVVPPCISRGSAGLFGLGHFFCNGKDQKSKKKSHNSLAKSSSRSASA